MKTKAQNTVKLYEMIKQGDEVCVALSGGADSVALLAFLRSVAGEYGISITACHVNHNLRGEESMRDENFVRALCTKWAVPLAIKSVDINALAAEKGLSIEEAGRHARYEFFEELNLKTGCKIATAHTLSDSAETMIFHIIRGTGLRGIAGISPVRGYVIRPLIAVTRPEVEDYCAENLLDFVTDSTNFSTDYTRNKIRIEIIPKMLEINPSFFLAAEGLARVAGENLSLARELAEDFLHDRDSTNLPAGAALKLHGAVLHEVLTSLAEKAGGRLRARHSKICAELLISGGSVELWGGTVFECKGDSFCIRSKKAQTARNAWKISLGNSEEFVKKLPLSVEIPNCCRIVFKDLSCEQIDNFDEQNNLYLKNTLVRGKICGNIFLRSKIEGDNITFLNRRVTKSLKKLFNEAKIPTAQRMDIPILADESGVLWVMGFGVDSHVALPQKPPYPAGTVLIEVKMFDE